MMFRDRGEYPTRASPGDRHLAGRLEKRSHRRPLLR